MINTRKIQKEIYSLVLPIIAENILQISAGIISTAMIGRLSASDISGLGISLRITDTLWCLYKGLGIGLTILIAQSFGAGNREKSRQYLSNAFKSIIPLAILFSIFLSIYPQPILHFFTWDTHILHQAAVFLKIIVFGFPFIVIMQIVTAACHGEGDTRNPMYIALLVNIVNIILGYSLIFGNFGFPSLGIKGAALSLLISQITGATLGLLLLYKKGMIKPGNKIGGLLPDKVITGQIYNLGLPAAFESMFWQFSAILLSKFILSYGTDSFAAYQLGIQAETITEMPAIGFGVAATTLTARAIGLKDKLLFKEYFKQLILFSLSISSLTSLILILLPYQFMHVLTDKQELIQIGAVYVLVMGFIQIPQNLSRIFNGAIRAAGYPRLPMYITAAGIWGFRIPLAGITAMLLGWEIKTIWLIIALDQIIRFTLSIIVYKVKKIEHVIEREPQISSEGATV